MKNYYIGNDVKNGDHARAGQKKRQIQPLVLAHGVKGKAGIEPHCRIPPVVSMVSVSEMR